MKIAALSATALGLVSAAAVATPSFAQDYNRYGYGYGDRAGYECAERQHDASVNGAVLGGIGGALLGASLAPHHGNRAGGAAIGAIAGALIGNGVARSNARGSDACEARDYGRVSYRGAAPYATYAPYERYGRGYERPYSRYTGYDPYSY
jgi:hypothetical protein